METAGVIIHGATIFEHDSGFNGNTLNGKNHAFDTWTPVDCTQDILPIGVETEYVFRFTVAMHAGFENNDPANPLLNGAAIDKLDVRIVPEL